jgi:hypothetical protein
VTAACHIEALYSFYEEETGIISASTKGAEGQTPTAATATKKPPPPSLPISSTDAEALPAAGEGGGVKVAASDRELRTRKPSEAPGPQKGGPSASNPQNPKASNDLWSAERKKNRSRPVVIMIQGVERVEAAAMRDLCQLLSQVSLALYCILHLCHLLTFV